MGENCEILSADTYMHCNLSTIKLIIYYWSR